MRGVRIDNETVQRMVAEYTGGASLVNLAGRFGFSYTGIRRSLSRVGGVIRKPGSGKFSRVKFSAIEIAEMIALYEGGATLREIGEEVGVSRFSVSKLLRRAGVQPRRRRSTRAKREAPAIIEAYENGLSLAAVGYRFGLSHVAVGNRLRAAGLQLRPRGPIAKCEKNERAEGVA